MDSETGDLAIDADRSLSISQIALFDPDADPSWTRRCAGVVAQLRAHSQASTTVWVPPEAELPHGDRTDFIRRIAGAAAGIEPGQRGQVEFPVTLTLKKLSDEASYVHVIGGLAPHWARLTGRTYGQYSLDTSAIHRLPEPEQRVAELLDWVALLGNGMKAGTSSELTAEDAWTVTRPARGDAFELVGAAPGSDPTNGTSVRKLLRTGLREASTGLATGVTARALVLLGVFRTMAEENATIALRSCDPSLYAAFDVVCLVADGQCRALVGPRPGVLAAR
jgi:hypothetical protein